MNEYDNRADVENLVGEARHNGLATIPSNRLQTIMHFFNW